MLIRREIELDVVAVEAVHAAAFARPGVGPEPPEVDLVRRLRSDRSWISELSMLAERGRDMSSATWCAP